jgi:hypothetical protein
MEMEREKREMEKERANKLEVESGHGDAVVLHSEVDLSDHHHESIEEEHHDDDDHDQFDYHNLSKQQLASFLKELSKEDDFKKIDRVLRELKPIVDETREKERTTALNRFILDGGIAEDFDYKGDELDSNIDSYLKQLKDKRTQHIRNLEDKKNENYNKKQELLERLRELIEAQEVADQFDKFKELQREWKNTGSVPGVHAKSLWASYHALVDRFYDNQSIYFELKELDRKKNLEAKIELCVRAEKLLTVENIKDAIKELNEFHHEFKHVGPVPIEEKEVVWQRFKAASDAVYAKRDEYLRVMQHELQQNLEQKNKLSEEVLAFADFSSDRIKEWNQKTKEILELQKKWEVVGGLPRNKAKDVNKKFWSSFKAFFSNKNAFFKRLDEERDTNLKKKEELVKKALELKESEDWDKTSNTLKSLQQQWKDIGPVPEKQREKIFKEFKEACDYFFEQKREQYGKQEDEQKNNLKVKESICEELEKHATEKTASLDRLHQLEEQFNEVGFVPRKDISKIRNRYHEAIQKFVGSIPDLSEDDQAQVLLESQLMDLKNDPMADRKIYQKEQSIRKKIQKAENDIAVWKNNLEFFARSKNAEQVRDEFNEKIQSASDHLKQLKQQLKMLRAVS